MAWNGEDFQSRRSELLARVRDRGEQLRQRRRLAWTMAVPLVLLAVAIPAALALNRPDGERTTVAAGGPGTSAVTTTTVVPAILVPTTTTETSLAPPPTTFVPRTTTTAPTSPGNVSTVPPETTVPPPPDTTTTSTTTSSTTIPTEPPGPWCRASFFESSATVDKPAYRPGETVTMTATYKNVSGQTCYWGSQVLGVDVFDASGTRVTQGARVAVDRIGWTALPAGDVYTTHPTWDQKVCGPAGCTTQAPPGTYTIVDVNESFGSARATFQLLAS